jgi:hypothetical protein
MALLLLVSLLRRLRFLPLLAAAGDAVGGGGAGRTATGA